MLQRRDILCRLGRAGFAAALGITFSAWAQRPMHPIARPPRPERPVLPGVIVPGSTEPDDGVASGPPPGIFTVMDVDRNDQTLRLLDEGGRTAIVHVAESVFDLETLKPGDQVEVDFLVPDLGSTRLEAGGLWKVGR